MEVRSPILGWKASEHGVIVEDREYSEAAQNPARFLEELDHERLRIVREVANSQIVLADKIVFYGTLLDNSKAVVNECGEVLARADTILARHQDSN